MRLYYRYPILLASTLLVGVAHASFTETFDDGTDVGNWILTTNTQRERTIQPTGGNPGAYLEGQVSTAVPTWSTASTRYQPGFNDEFKRDSVFDGNWTAEGVTTFGVDLNVIQAGDWATDRGLTLELMQMDNTGFSVAYDATLTLVDYQDDNPPVGWNHYDFNIGANGGSVPTGWTFTHGDGTAASDAEWSTFLSQVDLVSIEYGKPGYFYPSIGMYTLGIDNIQVQTAPVPEPASLSVLGLGALALIRRRRRR